MCGEVDNPFVLGKEGEWFSVTLWVPHIIFNLPVGKEILFLVSLHQTKSENVFERMTSLCYLKISVGIV